MPACRTLFVFVVVLVSAAAVRASNLLVMNSAGIHRYDETTGAYAGVFAAQGAIPIGFGYRSDGAFSYVSGALIDGARLYVQSPDSTYQQSGAYNGGRGFATDAGGVIYSAGLLGDGSSTRCIYRFDGLTPTVFATGSVGSSATAMTFGPDGDAYVTYEQAFAGAIGQVVRYDGQTGALEGVFATAPAPAQFAGLTFGPDGNLYVGSSTNHNVMKFDGTTGQYIADFITPDSGGLSGALDLKFQDDGVLYVLSQGSKVFRFNASTGAFQSSFVTNGPFSDNCTVLGIVVPEPSCIAVASLAILSLTRRRCLA